MFPTPTTQQQQSSKQYQTGIVKNNRVSQENRNFMPYSRQVVTGQDSFAPAPCALLGPSSVPVPLTLYHK